MSQKMYDDEIAVELEDGSQSIKFRMEYPAAFPIVYSNIARVTHSDHDICIDFARLTPPQDDPHQELVVRVAAQVLLTHSVAANLIGIVYKQISPEKRKELLQELQAIEADGHE